MGQPLSEVPDHDHSPTQTPRPSSNPLRVALITMSVLLAYAIILLLLFHSIGIGRSTTTVTIIVTVPAVTATATPVRGALAGPTLGGMYSAFLVTYGSPTRGGDTYGAGDAYGGGAAEWDSINIAGQGASLQMSVDQGLDYQAHILSLQTEPSGDDAWDTATAFKVISALLPADSHFVRDDTSLPHFLTHIYTSAALAVTWGSAPFVNDAGQPTPLGGFSVGCQLNSAGRITACFMSPGVS